MDRMEEGRGTFKMLIGKTTRKRRLGKHRWEENIKTDCKEIGFNKMKRINSARTGIAGKPL